MVNCSVDLTLNEVEMVSWEKFEDCGSVISPIALYFIVLSDLGSAIRVQEVRFGMIFDD